MVLPLKAIAMNVLSLAATFGALVWVFQDGHFAGVLGFAPTGALDLVMPVVIFVFAFGLSMDYEVFMLARIKEAYDETGDNDAAVAVGLQRSGKIITTAALLIVLVFAGFVAGEIVAMKQLGLGLALAVIIDATIVRLLLVPAAMKLMGRWNWWAPRPSPACTHGSGCGNSHANSSLRDFRLDSVEERDDRVVEQVVAVARDHVPGAGDVDEPRVRHELEQLPRAFLAQQVADVPAHEQRRDRSARAAACRRSGSTSDERVLVRTAEPPVMNAGSQCQYQRPSSRCRRFFFSPARFGGPRAVGVVRAGSRRPPRRATRSRSPCARP